MKEVSIKTFFFFFFLKYGEGDVEVWEGLKRGVVLLYFDLFSFGMRYERDS